jgi:hypothetical membrane protein
VTTTPLTAHDASTTTSTGSVPTRALLTAGAAAAPLWTVVALTQALTRDGFDLTRHPFSMLANGSPGWIQITNFLLVGTLFLAAAAGLRRALHGTAGGTWAPRLVRVVGIGMLAAGVLVLDPADGFPTGTPAGVPQQMSWQSVLHLVAGTATFAALLAACLVLGRHFARAAQPRTAHLCRTAAAAVAVGNGWAMTGGPAGPLALAIGVITAMACVSCVSWVAARHRSHR